VNWEKTFANYTSDEEITTRKDEELLKLNWTNDPIFKSWQ
jgi:hypothetical protein